MITNVQLQAKMEKQWHGPIWQPPIPGWTALYTIPKVGSLEEKEEREKKAKKIYLPKEKQKKKGSIKAMAEEKGVSEKKIINGSKQEGIKRMPYQEVANRRRAEKEKGEMTYYGPGTGGQ